VFVHFELNKTFKAQDGARFTFSADR